MQDHGGVGKKQGWKGATLASIYDTLSTRHGHVIIDYLKIDIEFDEWSVLPDLIASGMTSKVRQMGVELHLNRDDSIDQQRAKMVFCLQLHGIARL